MFDINATGLPIRREVANVTSAPSANRVAARRGCQPSEEDGAIMAYGQQDDRDQRPPGGRAEKAPVVTARDLMRAATTTVERGAHVAAASFLMKQSASSALVVTSDDGLTPLAIMTDADIARVVADGRDVGTTRISDIGSPALVVVSSQTPVGEIAQTMLTAGVEHVPVVELEKLVGIVGIGDVCRALLATSNVVAT